jgi:hypothetical protein
MQTHEETIRQQHLSLLAQFTAAFPGITPPEKQWFQMWIHRYHFSDITAAIETLSHHHLKHLFTTESTGKAISALLRQSAVGRAMTTPPVGEWQS